MNDKMLDIIGLADEKYLHEAEGKPVMKQTKHRRKFSAKVIAIAAAAGNDRHSRRSRCCKAVQ